MNLSTIKKNNIINQGGLTANSGQLDGNLIIAGLKETKGNITASNQIDLATGNIFVKTINVATTFSILNGPSSGQCSSFVLELVNGGAYPITWFNGITWSSGLAPVLTMAGVDVLGFYSTGNGVWRGFVLSKDIK